ncbi:regulatory protein GemA [Parasphingorhabdus sp.]|uniref:regulatory protein GemA n=1 Tax=Parasphingorhabdus sp. TaxID=2709688 RepID=UPI003A93FDFD
MNWKKRIQLVQIAKRQLGLSDERYRAALREYAGVESSTKMDDTGFDRLMDHFRSLGFVSDKRQASFSSNDRIGMATAGQVSLIRELWNEVSNGGSEISLNKWISRFGVSALRFLDDKTAPKVIAGLKGWKARLEEQGHRDT